MSLLVITEKPTPTSGAGDAKQLSSRRSHLEIRMDMLRAVKEGAIKPTQIMYRANISWGALQTNLRQLVERGMVEWVKEGTRKRYELTAKGSGMVYAYSKIEEELGDWVSPVVPNPF